MVIMVNSVSDVHGSHIGTHEGLREVTTSFTTKGEIEGLEEVIEAAEIFSSKVKSSHNLFYNKKDKKRKTICVQVTGYPQNETGNTVTRNFISDKIEPVMS